MGQREKAREIVSRDVEFSVTSSLPAEQVIDLARKAAEQSKRGLGAGIRHHGDQVGESGLQSAVFSVRGPGGVVGIMDFVVLAQPDAGSTVVTLSVGDFLFQKGSLGMRPTINAKSTMDRFLTHFKQVL